LTRLGKGANIVSIGSLASMILVVGGAGYIGSHTNKLLSQNGYKTVVFDNLATGHKEFVKWGEFFLGDLADIKKIRRCFEKYPIESVMHFAAFSCAEESIVQPAKYYQNNVCNTLHLLNVMKEFNVRFFVFSSSCSVYGIPKSLPIQEEHPRYPISPYGRTKKMVENMLEDFDRAYGLKYVNLRYFNAAGADFDGQLGEWHVPETHLIPLAINTALGINPEIKLFGTDYPTEDGTCIRDYIHVNDLAEAHIKALDHLLSTHQSAAFNLGNGEGFSVKEVLDEVQKVGGKIINIVETQKRPGDPAKLISNSQKACKILGWNPRYPDLNTLIRSAWNWHRKRKPKI
jgi:UDP-glucose 4-epimerase